MAFSTRPDCKRFQRGDYWEKNADLFGVNGTVIKAVIRILEAQPAGTYMTAKELLEHMHGLPITPWHVGRICSRYKEFFNIRPPRKVSSRVKSYSLRRGDDNGE